MSIVMDRNNLILKDDIFRALNGIKEDAGISYAVTIDALFSGKGDRISTIISEFIGECGNKVSTKKLEGIMFAFREWQLNNTLSGKAQENILHFIRRRILGGDPDDSTWINLSLEIVSKSYSFERLKTLSMLSVSRYPIPVESQAQYMKTLKLFIQHATQNNIAFSSFINELLQAIADAKKSYHDRKDFFDSIEKLFEDSNKENGKAIVFIHGLGGHPRKTWGIFPKLIEEDINFKNHNITTIFFQYPTNFFSIPFLRKKPLRIKYISDCLHAEILYKLNQFNEICFVCHSLGGLIVKNFLLREFKNKGMNRNYSAIYFATPHTGTSLAKLASYVSPLNYQIKQICRNSEFLVNLIEEWNNYEMDSKIKQLNVIGGQDEIVEESDMGSSCNSEQIIRIADKGHKDLVKPIDKNDMIYLVVKKFIFE